MFELPEKLQHDSDGMLSYEYLVNNIDLTDDALSVIIDNMEHADSTGQFVASTARYLAAVDKVRFKSSIDRLIKLAIDKDKERNYLASLLQSMWGSDYADHIDELRGKDDNFRRIYKRLYPTGSM